MWSVDVRSFYMKRVFFYVSVGFLVVMMIKRSKDNWNVNKGFFIMINGKFLWIYVG